MANEELAPLAKLLSAHLVKPDLPAARRLIAGLDLSSLPDGSNFEAPELVAALKLRSLAAEVLDYLGYFTQAEAFVSSATQFCETALSLPGWGNGEKGKTNSLLLQLVWLVLNGGLSDYRRGNYERALHLFSLCRNVIHDVVPLDSSDPRWGTRARIEYSLGLAFRERAEWDHAQKCFTTSTEYAYLSLNRAKDIERKSETTRVSWLTYVAIARSIGMGLASVHMTTGRADLAMPLLLASRAMLPEEESLVSTHLDMLRLNLLSVTAESAEDLDQVISDLKVCRQNFLEQDHALYLARAAYYLVRARLKRASLADAADQERRDLSECDARLLELGSMRTRDSRFPLMKLALESWMHRLKGGQKNLKKAEETATQGLSRTGPTIHPEAFIELCIARGKARTQMKRYQEAEKDFAHALRVAERTNNPWQRAFLLLLLCHLHLGMGDRVRASKDQSEFKRLKSNVPVCIGEVRLLEEAVNRLFEKPAEIFCLRLDEELEEPKQKLDEFKSFLAKWARRRTTSDQKAADLLGVGRDFIGKGRRRVAASAKRPRATEKQADA